MSLDHSSSESRLTPGSSAKAASASAPGSSPPRAAHLRAAVGALTAAPAVLSQQAPAKGWAPGMQPTLWPLTVCASTALTALSAVCASTALCAVSAVSAWAAFGTCPRLSSLMSEPFSGAFAATSGIVPGFSRLAVSECGFSRLAATECGFSRLPGIDFARIALPLIFARFAA